MYKHVRGQLDNFVILHKVIWQLDFTAHKEVMMGMLRGGGEMLAVQASVLFAKAIWCQALDTWVCAPVTRTLWVVPWVGCNGMPPIGDNLPRWVGTMSREERLEHARLDVLTRHAGWTAEQRREETKRSTAQRMATEASETPDEGVARRKGTAAYHDSWRQRRAANETEEETRSRMDIYNLTNKICAAKKQKNGNPHGESLTSVRPLTSVH